LAARDADSLKESDAKGKKNENAFTLPPLPTACFLPL